MFNSIIFESIGINTLCLAIPPLEIEAKLTQEGLSCFSGLTDRWLKDYV